MLTGALHLLLDVPIDCLSPHEERFMPSSDPEPQIIDVRGFLAVIRRRRRSIALVTLIVTGLAVGFIAWREPVYTSTARVEVRPTTLGAPLEPFANMDTEAARVTSEPVAALAAREVGIDRSSPTELANATSGVDVSIPGNTTYLDISCTESSPERATACADAFANAYATDRIETAQRSYSEASAALFEDVRRAEKKISAEEAQPSPDQDRIDSLSARQLIASSKVVSLPTPSSDAAVLALSADVPTQPSNKDYVLAGALALVLGLALSIGLAFMRDRLDQRIPGRAGLEDTIDAPVLGVIPRVKGWRHEDEARLVSLSDPHSMAAEAYRTARTAILYRASTNDIRVIEITSPGEREGKTTTTANLAVSLAQTGKSVVAISCDLRRPRLHQFFGLDNSLGLSNLLAGELDPRAILETEVQGLRVITSGPVPSYPAELLESAAMDELIRWLRGKADFVLLDTAPALIVADAMALAPRCDGVVIVADARNTTRAALARVRHELSSVGVPIVGAILNRLGPAQAKRYPDQYGAYYSSSYRYRSDESNSFRELPPRGISKPSPGQKLEPKPGPAPEPARDVTPDVVELDPIEQLDPSEQMWRS
jgi:polysaccharide biosynthesis transport protein